ncbi:MAG TPA: ribokinase [Flexilinea sp.]|nr:ribokinase [Flexilinea sp.]
MKKIFVIGSLNMDLVFNYDIFPEKGETVVGESFMINEGGKGANQAIASARQGAKVMMVGCVGNDLYGRKLIETMNRNNVDVSNIRIHQSESTGTALIMVGENNNRIIIIPGANSRTSKRQIYPVFSKVEKGDILLCQMEIPCETVFFALEEAKKQGMFTILNPAPAKNIPDNIYQYIDLIIPNETEAKTISGISCNDEDSYKKTIEYFCNKGVREVIITLGEKGAVYGAKKTFAIFSSHPAQIIDTTAAGDTFVGTIAAEVSKGKQVSESVDKACIAASIAISRHGAMQSIPTEAEIQEIIRKEG